MIITKAMAKRVGCCCPGDKYSERDFKRLLRFFAKRYPRGLSTSKTNLKKLFGKGYIVAGIGWRGHLYFWLKHVLLNARGRECFYNNNGDYNKKIPEALSIALSKKSNVVKEAT